MRASLVAMMLGLLVFAGCTSSAGEDPSATSADRGVRAQSVDPDPEQEPDPTSTPGPTSTPAPTSTITPSPTEAPDPTATAAPTTPPRPSATPRPTVTPTETPAAVAAPTEAATATPTSDSAPTPTLDGADASDDPADASSDAEGNATPEPDRTPVPVDYDGPVRAVRTSTGVMLTVQSDGPPWQVITPCFNLTTASLGLPIEGPVDVLIDPGHGGEETGAVGPNGLVEADVNLDVAEALRERLIEAGHRVLLTRYSDHRVAIQARTALANALQPRIFISIHHNGGFPDPVDRPGTEVFVQQDADDSRRLGGLLFEEMQAEFADVDIDWVGTDALGVSWRINERGTDLYGILRRTPDLVTVLTEAMYMNTAPEAEFLATDEAIDREADALFRGIERYFTTDAPGSGFIDGLVFRGDLGTGGGTDGCVDPEYE